MDENTRKGITRREFIKHTGAGLLAAGLGTDLIIPGRARAAEKTLKILQWAHFVPRYDTEWFDRFAREWGEAKNVKVTVDHIGLPEIPARTAAEISAGEGHDLIEWISPPAQFEPSVLDLADVNQEAQRRFGKQLPLATLSSYNPHTKKYYGFSHGWAIDPGNYRKSLWAKVGKPDGPEAWEDLVTFGGRIKKELGIQLGVGLSQELDSTMAAWALLWSFDTSIQDAQENVIINNPRAVEVVEYMTRLYKAAMVPEVFSWTPVSNNRALIAGRASYIVNSVSAYRSAQKQVPEIAKDIFFVPALKGPRGARWSSEHVIYVYIIPSYSKSADLAKEFLLHLVANYDQAMYSSELYNSPAFFDAPVPSGSRGYPPVPGARSVRDLHNAWFEDDPFRIEGEAKGKLSPLKAAMEWSANVGYPGPGSPAVGEVFSTFILPNMLAKAVQGMKAADAVAEAELQIKRSFSEWRKRGLIGGKA